MRTERESKRKPIQNLWGHLPASNLRVGQLHRFLFILQNKTHLFLWSIFSPSWCLLFLLLSLLGAFPTAVSSRPLFLLPPCHHCRIIYEVLKNLLCNQGLPTCESHSVKSPGSYPLPWNGVLSEWCPVWPAPDAGLVVLQWCGSCHCCKLFKFPNTEIFTDY